MRGAIIRDEDLQDCVRTLEQEGYGLGLNEDNEDAEDAVNLSQFDISYYRFKIFVCNEMFSEYLLTNMIPLLLLLMLLMILLSTMRLNTQRHTNSTWHIGKS